MTLPDASLAIARGALLLAEALVFGTLVVRALTDAADPGRITRAGFVALAVLGPLWVVLQAQAIVGATDLPGVAQAVLLVLQASWVGHVAIARAAFWGLTALATAKPRLAVLPAAAAMALHAASGHAAAEGDPVLLASVLAHVLAAGAWIGGLPMLWLGLRQPAPERLLRRFSWLGLGCVLVLLATALWQANALAGGLPGLVGTDYGHLLLIKLTLLACLLALACRNQFVLVPRAVTGLRSLRRSVAFEAGLGALTLLAASLLSALPPGAHEQANWPFPVRLSLDALADEDLRAEVLQGLLTLAVAGVLLVAGLWPWGGRWRRLRWPALALAVMAGWQATPHLTFLLVPAEPTYYWESPSGDTPSSIAAGRLAFAANCVACHGAGGHGDGPLAAGLTVPPADLTAPHLWEHSDGELYWWISHGMRAPDGSLAMPGFADRLDDDTRWALIDFLHANNPNGAPAPGAHHHH